MKKPQDILDLPAIRGDRLPQPGTAAESRRQVIHELISSGTGVFLALFMVGHMGFVGSILLGTRAFDWVAETMEVFYIAQPTVIVIFIVFLVHAVMASRKIPARLRERRRFIALGRELKHSSSEWQATGDAKLPAHLDSWLWIWQVRTGMLILVFGCFHLMLMMLNIFTALFGEPAGIQAAISMERTAAGLVWLYLVTLLCLEFHGSVGLFRVAIKWGIGARLGRKTLHYLEQFLFWFFVILGILIVVVLAGWIDPPLAFLLEGGG